MQIKDWLADGVAVADGCQDIARECPNPTVSRLNGDGGGAECAERCTESNKSESRCGR